MLNKLMEIFERFYIVKIGMRFCNTKILPLIIARIEPEDSNTRPPLFGASQSIPGNPNTVVTYMEADRMVGYYLLAFLVILYCAIPVLGLLGYTVSLILEVINSLVKLPAWVETAIYSLLLITFLAFWAGVMISIRKRKKIWEEARDNEFEIQKLEYFAIGKSSEIMAKILFEIGKLKEEREEELGRVKRIRKKRTILDVETMKMFNAMMDEREKKIRREERIKTILFSGLSWILGASMTYVFEKSLDYWLYGSTPNFISTEK